ncbi:putative RNA-binding protein [Bradyrhizobium sp. AZCC 1610]|uniref:hypothetical protein n=1 Tax=Bradyrhizobium sp. AZCC 1610 TaxID=3117020 RepID=UPI002FF1047B
MLLIHNIDPAVIESRDRAMKLADYYLRKGEDAFTFENEAGRAYVITRKMGVEPFMATGDKLVGYASSRLADVIDLVWSEPGKA